MKRYFDLQDDKQTLMVEAKAGSAGALVGVEGIAKHFKISGRIREIEKGEYLRLTKEYTEAL